LILGILASLGLNVFLIKVNGNIRRWASSSSYQGAYHYNTSVPNAIANGQSFYASLDDLRRLAKLSPAQRVRDDDHRYPTEWTETQRWQVVSLEDGLHVRGWHDLRPTFVVGGTSVTNSDGLLLSEPVDANSTTRTVPISKFKELRDPKFLVPSPVVDGVTYPDRHGEAVELK
jgi:hypothetical protein